MFAAAAAPTPARAQRVLLRGQVMDAESGQPVRSAIIEVRPFRQSAVTDEQGRFAVRATRGPNSVAADAMGYESAVAAVSLSGDTTDVTIELKRDPVRLQGVVATVSRLERRRRAYGYASRALNTDQIAVSSAPDAWTLVREEMGVTMGPCGGRGGGRFGGAAFMVPCVYVRGSAEPLRVYVDETRMPDATALALYTPSELAGVEFYPSSAQVRVYTRWFIEWAAKRDYRPMPLTIAF